MVDYLNIERFKKYIFIIVNRKKDEIVYAGVLSDDVDKYFNKKDHKIRIYKDGKEIKGEKKKKVFDELRKFFALNMYIEKKIPRMFYDRPIFLIESDSNILRELEKEIKKNKELIKDLNRLLALIRKNEFKKCFIENGMEFVGDIVSIEIVDLKAMIKTNCFIGKIISRLTLINRDLSSILRKYYYRQDEE